jgi:hypothetical protein
MGDITACQICGSTDLTVILDMGSQPLAERFDHPKVYPLALQQCGECTLVQLTHAVDQREVFPEDHPYRSGHTKALVEHFVGLSNRVARYLGDGDLAVDLGCNDGSFLSLLRPGVRRAGVEPTNQAVKATARGLMVFHEFFTASTVAAIRAEFGQPAKVVTATNVLAHVPDCHDFVQGVADLLADDGVFVSESHDVASVLDGQWDAIYHEHLRYYSLTSLSRLLGMHGLTITDVERIPTHGGSLRVFARKQRQDLGARAWKAATDLHHMLADLAGHGEAVYGIGATTRATPLIHYANIAKYLECVCEVPGSEKIGFMMPGTQVPVVDESRLLEDQPPWALLLSWHVADSIVKSLRAKGYKGRFIVPLPEPRVLDG